MLQFQSDSNVSLCTYKRKLFMLMFILRAIELNYSSETKASFSVCTKFDILKVFSVIIIISVGILCYLNTVKDLVI